MKLQKLTPSKGKPILFLLICIVFTLGSLLIIWTSDDFRGWLCLIFGGTGVVFFGSQLIPGAYWLYLDKAGFTVHLLNKTHRYLWTDIQELGIIKIRSNKMVAFNFTSDFNRGKAGRKFSRTLSGFEGALPISFGHNAEELLHLMKQYKHNNANAADKKTAAD